MAQLRASGQDKRLFEGSAGGGFAMSVQGSLGIEAAGHYLWSLETGHKREDLYQIGPEAMVGWHVGAPQRWSLHGERIGLKQLWLYKGAFGITATAGAENYSYRFALDDSRWFLQCGPTLLGCISLEYGWTYAMTARTPFVDQGRVMLRLEINAHALERVFRGVPIS
ncbi:MAG: hypothetical protein WAT74_13305 [Flavobacteriales bacterium]